MSASHILVVDDESDIRSLIQEILSDEGYDVTVAADAAEARDARDKSKPGSRVARYLDARHRRDYAAARMVAAKQEAVSRRHDVRTRHGRYRGRGNPAGRL